jgi:alpha-L-fucosidase 2
MPHYFRGILIGMLICGTVLGEEHFPGVEYARPNGESLLFDAVVPDGAGPFPAAILVHGGGWVHGDRHTEMAPLFQPLTAAGIAWFSIDYRLAKDPLTFGMAYKDVEAAVRFVREHAAEYHVDPNRIALIGESAGGHLAAMAALAKDADARVQAVVALYGPMDLAALATGNSMLPDSVRENMMGTPWGGLIMGRLAQLSPAQHVRAEMPPFLFIHGTADELVPIQQSRDMCGKMKALGNACEVYAVPGGGHGMRHWKSAAYQKEMLRWLGANL